MANFEEELRDLINRHSRENGPDTPDHLLAQYLERWLKNFDFTVRQREAWYGRGNLAATQTEPPAPEALPSHKGLAPKPGGG